MPQIQLRFRRGTSLQWSTADPVLGSGEMGIETDTQQFKIGDGLTVWTLLPYGGLVGPTGPLAIGPTGDIGPTGEPGPTGPSGETGPTGPIVYYNFDGGEPATVYTYGPAFNAGGAATGTLAIEFQFRKGTPSEWQTASTILAIAEPGYEISTNLFKIGDGVTEWNSLPYAGFTGPTGSVDSIGSTNFILYNNGAGITGSDLFTFDPNSGPSGEVRIKGKLTVDGIIDPIAMVLVPQDSNPLPSTAGTFWIDRSTNVPYYDEKVMLTVKKELVQQQNVVLFFDGTEVQGQTGFNFVPGQDMTLEGDFLPNSTNTYNLGNSTIVWKSLYLGSGQLTFSDQSGTSTLATLGQNNENILYAPDGFATPFVNIGPTKTEGSLYGDLGGWHIGPTGIQGSDEYDLVATEKDQSGNLVGKTYSLIHPEDPLTLSSLIVSSIQTISISSYQLNADSISANEFTTTSDQRFKQNIEPVQNALPLIDQLNPVYYNWINKQTLNKDHKELGFLAQELEKVIPNVVKTNSDGYKSVAYANLTSLLVAGMKEQQQTIHNLQNQINELKQLFESQNRNE
jgi:hypothetical protein